MALGDGIRRNIAHVSDTERNRFISAVLQLNSRFYPDGVSKWVKQDQIHEATHVHGGPSFLPWHRELLNRYEKLLREIDPELSLHYWDWTDDPRAADDGSGGTFNIFTNSFMGESNGNVGAPLAGFPPISRDVAGGAALPSPPSVDSDASIISSSDGLPQNEQWEAFRETLEGSPNHNSVHGYIGGTIGFGHTALRILLFFSCTPMWIGYGRVGRPSSVRNGAWTLYSLMVMNRTISQLRKIWNLGPEHRV